jgi:hypothetical protein
LIPEHLKQTSLPLSLVGRIRSFFFSRVFAGFQELAYRQIQTHDHKTKNTNGNVKKHHRAHEAAPLIAINLK